jgi:hypothetical protein
LSASGRKSRSSSFESSSSCPFPLSLPLLHGTSGRPGAPGSDSQPLSLGVILGIVCGILAIAAALSIGFVLLRFRCPKDTSLPSSDDARPDLVFVESTLHETIVTFSDSVTVEGSRATPLLSRTSAPPSFRSLG